MKRISIFLLLVLSVALAQGMKSRIKYDVIKIPEGNEFNIFLFFELPVDILSFEKDNNKFISRFLFQADIKKDSKIIKSESAEQFIQLPKYDDTINKEKSVSGVLNFKLSSGVYEINANLQSVNSSGLIKLPVQNLELTNNDTLAITPLITKENGHLTVLEKTIPFSKEKYSVNFFVGDTSVKSLKVKIKQEGYVDSVIISDYTQGTPVFRTDNYSLFLDVRKSNISNIFQIKEVNKKLLPLKTEIIVEKNVKETYKYEFNCLWVDAPITFTLKEYSLDLLNIIDEKSHKSDLADEKIIKYLFNYWAKYDSDTSTSFNEIMEEFYRRADYALSSFVVKDVRGNSGKISDQAKTFIKFGQPDDIKRDYNKRDETIEIWIYKNINKTFYFRDNSGAGDYYLVN